MALVALQLLFSAAAFAQQIGYNTPENHPPLSTLSCSLEGTCSAVSASIVLDANWRWLHDTSSSTNCYTGNQWNPTYCPDPVTCAQKCALDGADYSGTYGITTSGSTLSLRFVTYGPYSTNVGSRTYLMQDDDSYRIFKLKNQEFSFDVDVSQLPCGLNGALYFVPMVADGGKSQFPNNKAGARYGTGYCDGQCPHDDKFINGEANLLDWTPTSANSGSGRYGTCCQEIDVWEANSQATAYTAHPCDMVGPYRCDSQNGTECGDGSDRQNGVCDKDGCDLNPFRAGNTSFFGVGSNFIVDTSKTFTVTTQFITSDNTASGTLVEIRRFYSQGGVTIAEPKANNVGSYNSVTDSYCSAQKNAYGDPNTFAKKGGLSAQSKALDQGVVLVMSLWDDYEANMLWLDSNYPTTANPSQPGIARGPCPTSSGKPSDVESEYPTATIKFSNIAVGPIGFTESMLKQRLNVEAQIS